MAAKQHSCALAKSLYNFSQRYFDPDRDGEGSKHLWQSRSIKFGRPHIRNSIPQFDAVDGACRTDYRIILHIQRQSKVE